MSLRMKLAFVAAALSFISFFFSMFLVLVFLVVGVVLSVSQFKSKYGKWALVLNLFVGVLYMAFTIYVFMNFTSIDG